MASSSGIRLAASERRESRIVHGGELAGNLLVALRSAHWDVSTANAGWLSGRGTGSGRHVGASVSFAGVVMAAAATWGSTTGSQIVITVGEGAGSAILAVALHEVLAERALVVSILFSALSRLTAAAAMRR